MLTLLSVLFIDLLGKHVFVDLLCCVVFVVVCHLELPCLTVCRKCGERGFMEIMVSAGYTHLNS